MIEANEIVGMIRDSIPGAEVRVEDMTGERDHFNILVVSAAFEKMMLIEQHRMIQKPIQAAMDDGRIHAVQIKTVTPAQWQKSNQATQDNGLNIIS